MATTVCSLAVHAAKKNRHMDKLGEAKDRFIAPQHSDERY